MAFPELVIYETLISLELRSKRKSFPTCFACSRSINGKLLISVALPLIALTKSKQLQNEVERKKKNFAHKSMLIRSEGTHIVSVLLLGKVLSLWTLGSDGLDFYFFMFDECLRHLR
jgi:hypothetical protein